MQLLLLEEWQILGIITEDKLIEPAWQIWFELVAEAFPKISTYSVAVTPASVAANTTDEQTFTVEGLAVRDIVVVGGAHKDGVGIAGARVSAADTLSVTYVNPTGGALTPTAETYKILAVRR